MTILHFLIVFTYSATIGMFLLVASAYLGKVEGLWPPYSRVVLVAGWIWYLSSFIAALLLSFFESPVEMPLNGVLWKILGFLFIAMSGVLGFWAFLTFRSVRRISGENIDTLITWGPYRYVRNPQYTSGMLFLFGITLIQNSLYFLLFTVMEVATFHIISLLEEKELEKIFDEEFIKYKGKVPRYLPRLKRD